MQEVKVIKNVLEANDLIADNNRKLFKENNVFVINIISAPGAGKTTMLEKTIAELKSKLRIAVIEGDIATTRDADRLAKFDIPVVQINTEGGCHLDANMIANSIRGLNLAQIDLLIIENVGNMVCPAEFDVGENSKVSIISIAEGEDKPQKYPLIFQVTDVCLVNKMDLKPYLDISVENLISDIQSINPTLTTIKISAKTGDGLNEWHEWLMRKKG
ncbi:MAG: hydrogenase nickel incorporation protein HypB [Pseudomonadota bacterium]